MRIIAGRFRSRKLHAPKDSGTTRPIPDRVKESLFSILRGNCEGAMVLDAFAGTGAIGLEALSRGAASVVFVEKDRRSGDMLEKNIELLGVQDECTIVRGDALGPAALARCPNPVDMVFMDPPYPVVLDPARWPQVQRQLSRFIDLLSESGYAILRTPWPFRHVQVHDQNGLIIPHGDSRNPFDVFGRIRKDMPPPSGKRMKGRHGRVRDDDDEDDVQMHKAWEGDHIDLDEITSETVEDERILDALAETGPTRGLKIIRQDVDLTLANAAGPETHIYASQAVHLYMRKPS